jgi:hypothetical protein
MWYRRGTPAGMLEPYDSTCYNAPYWCKHVVLRWALNIGALGFFHRGEWPWDG